MKESRFDAEDVIRWSIYSRNALWSKNRLILRSHQKQQRVKQFLFWTVLLFRSPRPPFGPLLPRLQNVCIGVRTPSPPMTHSRAVVEATRKAGIPLSSHPNSSVSNSSIAFQDSSSFKHFTPSIPCTLTIPPLIISTTAPSFPPSPSSPLSSSKDWSEPPHSYNLCLSLSLRRSNTLLFRAGTCPP